MNRDLLYDKKTGWDRLDDIGRQRMEELAGDYRRFLDRGKTERDAVSALVEMAERKGFRPFARGMEVKPGDRYYQVNRHKAVTLMVIGQRSLAEGISLTGAHLDAPRVDIRTVPLYEDSEMAFFKTHYYGGIKKYQWTTIPLELRGVVYTCDKEGNTGKVDVHIGQDPADPVFVITDLLPHLAGEQMRKTMMAGIPGESLNILIGSEPDLTMKKEDGDRVKMQILQWLNRTYGIREEDFLSAELCAVPAFNAREVGFDRSLIGSYGHDDRVCAFSAAQALLDLEQTPDKTAMCLLVDREEVGSDGVTGMQSQQFDTLIADLCRAQQVLPQQCLENSTCLSADVANAYDPNYPDVSDTRNDARLNCGLVITRHTGVRGKSDSSEASAELMARVRSLFARVGVVWQTGELGKVDQGGGGTIAKYVANRNVDTVDAGVPVLSMHAPFEVVSKLDLYMAYLGFLAFYNQ